VTYYNNNNNNSSHVTNNNMNSYNSYMTKNDKNSYNSNVKTKLATAAATTTDTEAGPLCHHLNNLTSKTKQKICL
jgi:hypothetical protein